MIKLDEAVHEYAKYGPMVMVHSSADVETYIIHAVLIADAALRLDKEEIFLDCMARIVFAWSVHKQMKKEDAKNGKQTKARRSSPKKLQTRV